MTMNRLITVLLWLVLAFQASRSPHRGQRRCGFSEVWASGLQFARQA